MLKKVSNIILYHGLYIYIKKKCCILIGYPAGYIRLHPWLKLDNNVGCWLIIYLCVRNLWTRLIIYLGVQNLWTWLIIYLCVQNLWTQLVVILLYHKDGVKLKESRSVFACHTEKVGQSSWKTKEWKMFWYIQKKQQQHKKLYWEI